MGPSADVRGVQHAVRDIANTRLVQEIGSGGVCPAYSRRMMAYVSICIRFRFERYFHVYLVSGL